MKGFTYF